MFARVDSRQIEVVRGPCIVALTAFALAGCRPTPTNDAPPSPDAAVPVDAASAGAKPDDLDLTFGDKGVLWLSPEGAANAALTSLALTDEGTFGGGFTGPVGSERPWMMHLSSDDAVDTAFEAAFAETVPDGGKIRAIVARAGGGFAVVLASPPGAPNVYLVDREGHVVRSRRLDADLFAAADDGARVFVTGQAQDRLVLFELDGTTLAGTTADVAEASRIDGGAGHGVLSTSGTPRLLGMVHPGRAGAPFVATRTATTRLALACPGPLDLTWTPFANGASALVAGGCLHEVNGTSMSGWLAARVRLEGGGVALDPSWPEATSFAAAMGSGDPPSVARGAAVDADERVLLAGVVTVESGRAAQVTRLHLDGGRVVPDGTFGQAGSVRIPGGVVAAAVAVRAGRVWMAGSGATKAFVARVDHR